MSTQTPSRLERLKSAARRVGGIVRAMEESPFETLERRVRRLKGRLADLDTAREPLPEATPRIG
jgi:chromosome segregation ATPase